MRVLLTGALGNLGRPTIDALLARGHEVRAFDLPTRANRRTARSLDRRVEVVYGNALVLEDVERAVRGVDAVIHDAALLPPASERNPGATHAVNVRGAENVLRAFEKQNPTGPFVLASSFSVYGPEAASTGFVTSETPTRATDAYTKSKLDAEALVKASSAPWVILRIAAALEASASTSDPVVIRYMFEVDPTHPIEVVHAADVARAQAAAVDVVAARGRILPIGGGPSCQIRYRDLFGSMERVLGLRPLPPSAFGKAPFTTCWLDTRESEALLRFQTRSFEEIQKELLERYRFVTPLVAPFAPLVSRGLLTLSGPYRGDAPRTTWSAFVDR